MWNEYKYLNKTQWKLKKNDNSYEILLIYLVVCFAEMLEHNKVIFKQIVSIAADRSY